MRARLLAGPVPVPALEGTPRIWCQSSSAAAAWPSICASSGSRPKPELVSPCRHSPYLFKESAELGHFCRLGC